MGADQHFDWKNTAASALDWWRDAGVDALIDEAPRDWLAPAAPAEPVRASIRAFAAPEAAPALPDTLAAFEAWRTGPDAPEAVWHGRAIGAQGSAAAGLMIVVDLPEREDAETGMLLSGAAGRLFDRMLAAIGRDRASIYLVPLCAVRPPAGRIDPALDTRLAGIARHHVALAAPKRLLLLGNAPSRALLGSDVVKARGGLRALNQDGGNVTEGSAGAGETGAVASFHPRFLIERPAFKAESWKDLQMLIAGLD